jgi:hypothetical protein
MATAYGRNGGRLRYACSREAADYAAPLCQSLSGAALDARITKRSNPKTGWWRAK